MSPVLRRQCACAGLAILAILVVGVSPAGAAFPGDDGRIAYPTNNPGPTNDLWSVLPDGSDPIQLTDTPAADEFDPVYSADGSKIAYQSNAVDPANDIYVMDADGHNQTRLTTTAGLETEPAFSPTGKIAFLRFPAPDGLWIMNGDGSGQAHIPGTTGNDQQPAWSPDGNRIAFTRFTCGGACGDIWTIAPDGSDPQLLTPPAGGGDFYPNWSPDGSKIVFSESGLSIVTIDADGSNRTTITTNLFAAQDRDPDFSPTGDQIVYRHDTPNPDIAVVNADGSGLPTPVVSDPFFEALPTWQPLPPTDLVLTKTDSPDPATVGADLRYVLTAENDGPQDASDVEVVDTLPASVTFVSASSGCVEAPVGTVTCDLGDIPDGGVESAEIVVTPNLVGAISNTATVSSERGDSHPANNDDTEPTQVNPPAPPGPDSADLSLSKSDSPDPATVGENLEYTLSVGNQGPDDAAGVTVTDTLPPGVTFVSASSGCANVAGTVTCNLGSVGSGGSGSAEIVVKPTAAGTITNAASVSSATADPSASNNSDSEQTEVGAAPPVEGTPNDGTCSGQPATITGTPNDDTVVGTDGADVIDALGGDDQVRGLGGDDLVCGRGGDDLVKAGLGDDTVKGLGGGDDVRGQGGDDKLGGGAGGDELRGGVGADALNGGGGRDSCSGGGGTDTAQGNCEQVVGVP